MNDVKLLMEKYFEILNKQDYDTQIQEEMETADTIENFNGMLDSVILKMSPEQLILSLKQAFKRDLSKGQALGESDEVWDELNEFIENAEDEC